MLKRSNYIYGPQNMLVPAKLNLGDYILDKCWTYKDNIALINGTTDESIKYSQIVQEAMNFAIALEHMGLRKGDVVAIFSENRPEYWGSVIGSICAGAIITTISTAYVKSELIHVMNISKPKYVICSPSVYKNHKKSLKSLNFVKKIILYGTEKMSNVSMYNDLVRTENGLVQNVKYEDFLSVEVQGQTDTVFILYSSGTTGLPKGVMLTHLNVIAACCMPLLHKPNTMTLNISPWYHVMGLVGYLTALAVGKTMMYLSKFNINVYLKSIEKYKVAQLTVVPPILVVMCKHQSNYDVSSVKLIYSGAAPLMKDTIDAVHEKFPNVDRVLQGYGCTELTLGVLRYNYHDESLYRTGSVGTVVANTILKVVDIDTRKTLGPKESGEICAKGIMIMKGYIGKDSNEEFDGEGFYKTGDIGYYDEDGFFYIVDRLKELIKYKGYQVPPAELEAVLLQHDGIKDAAVIGIKDTVAGEVPLAFVVTQPGSDLSEKEIKDFIAQRLSNHKHLRGGVRFLDQIPKSASGKILRKELRKLVNSAKSKL